MDDGSEAKDDQRRKEGGKVDMRMQAAVSLAEQRFMAQMNEGSPAQLGVLATMAFRSDLWDAMAALPAEDAPTPIWHLAAA
jgi:hypothetical protein